MTEEFSLYIKFLHTNQPIQKVIKISGPQNGTSQNLINAINRIMKNIVVNVDKIIIDDIGEAQKENVNIMLKPCDWFFNNLIGN